MMVSVVRVGRRERGSEDRVGSHFTSRELMDSFPTGLIQESRRPCPCALMGGGTGGAWPENFDTGLSRC